MKSVDTTGGDPLAAFLAEPPAALSRVTVRRSELERWAECPFAAQKLANGEVKLVGPEAESGEQVHRAISATIQYWIEVGELLRPAEIKEQFILALAHSRPDVQPDVIKGGAPIAWEFANLLAATHPNNILRFDGGEELKGPGGRGNRSGQIAMDFSERIRLTCELDLLLASPAPTQLEIYDWKTGNGRFSALDVVNSFQFQFQAAVTFANYPTVTSIGVNVWNTRFNKVVPRVEFSREKLPIYHARLASALFEFERFGFTGEAPPTWPVRGKCETCDCRAICPAVDEIAGAFDDEQRFVDLIYLTKIQLGNLEKLGDRRSEALGRDLEGSEGLRFGRGKPSTRRQALSTYFSGDHGDGESENEEG